METYYAHSTESPDKSGWQTLEDHLQGVAGLARGFAAVFGAADWGELAGLLHDVGKATAAFQRRLEGNSQRVDHTTFGARLAREHGGPLGPLLSYMITGHHGGLPDGGAQETELHWRLKYGKVPEDASLLPSIELQNVLRWPLEKPEEKTAGFSMAFFTRMIFSCLVDADFLDTETFCTPEKAALRSSFDCQQLVDLREKLNLHLQKLTQKAEPTPVNRLRQAILQQCRTKAELAPQVFSLTVPTGGGKTLSSLAFALDHAVANKLQRVIYAIPFTSIIEQNARVFQDILGRESVLEHHCNYKEKDEPEEAVYNRRRGLATENWDAPVVVTTNVQFFESLFSNKPSRCRKLHNIAGSVIVLDEAQAIPTEYLEPCLAALRELVERYGCSLVLCTATQPALDDSALRNRLPKIHEVIERPQQLYTDLRRTEVTFIGKLTNGELAERLAADEQVLCIVSTKPQARKLFEMLPPSEGNFHLSTNMYPEHRRQVLDTIRLRLKQNMSCRVISTSLVEAGVDLDFPVVYRAMAGLDSIAQAAGRCNREGRMAGLGRVHVYEPEQPARMPWVKRCASRAEEALRSLPDADPIGLEVMRRFFALLYDVQELDKKSILSAFPNQKQIQLSRDFYFPFHTVAESFRFIGDETVGVIIPIEPGTEELVRQLRYTEFPRAVLRKLQGYSVAVRNHEFAVLNTAGALEMVDGQFPVLRNLSAYRDDVGLCAERGEYWDPGDMIG
ncbi:CRISPR-associated helicase/endonuclease Cas3 [Pelobacter seleniigenes]|uniref:CRISPR-associated helicase/endonuclease Cas3 n=1 Tax=Pelobacter seleniigenes TaxID=407188 RepID=UPI0004A6DBE9|nr:CRISPR-associated helicase/endonuclease Cas3 [Pelobacter seleniigenes]